MDAPVKLLNGKEDPTEYKHIKVMRFLLQTIGAWPGKELGHVVPVVSRLHGRLTPFLSLTALVGQIIYLGLYGKDISFLLKGQCCINTLLTFEGLIRCTLPLLKSYGKMIKVFFREFHLTHIKNNGEFNMKVFNTTEDLTNKLIIFLSAVTVYGLIFYNVPSWYNNSINGAFRRNRSRNITLEFAVFVAFPGFNPQDHMIVGSIVSFYLAYIVGISIILIDLVLYVLLLQIYGHIRILQNELSTMWPKSLEAGEYNKKRILMFNQQENQNIHEQLVHCIRHHTTISAFTDSLSTFFGPVLGVTYMFDTTALCLMMVQCSASTAAIISFGPLTALTFAQLIQTSVMFEIVTTASEKLKNSVYETPWEYMNTRNRRTVCIFLSRVQIPIRVKALGLASVGVTTMMSILKTTFSYFIFLRSRSRS